MMRMISEALELRVERGRVSHSRCMCVVSYAFGGLGGGRDGGGGSYAYGRKSRLLIACREMSEHFLSARYCTDGTRSHHHSGVELWVGSSRNWSVFLITGRHDKAPFRCPCNWLATLHGAPRTLV